MESEFSSIDDARAVEQQLRVVADNAAPAVVKLWEAREGEDVDIGSGVVITPSGLILTHGHHGRPHGTIFKAMFPDGAVVNAVVESVTSGRGRDFSLLNIQTPGQCPAVSLRREKPCAPGERCFHFGYPDVSTGIRALSTPVLRLGRVAGTGQCCTYSNCLITGGDSGGPLFDLEGRLIGVLGFSIGPDLRHPGGWADISRIVEGNTFLTGSDAAEIKRLGFTDGERKAADTQRHMANVLCPDLLAPAGRATVEVLVGGQTAVLGTIVDTDGIVLTKRSEIMTYRGALFGKLSCRLFDGEEVTAEAIFDSHEEDVALLQLPRRGLTSAPLSLRTEPRRGVIVVAPVPGKDVSETGVVSVDRPISIGLRRGNVALGVEMGPSGVTVDGSARDLKREGRRNLIRGSINEGDVITHVDGEVAPDVAAFVKQTKTGALTTGDFVELSVRRNGTTFQVFFPTDPDYPKYDDVSPRRWGFPAVLIHDTIVRRRECGGPVVDLEGRVVGVNIARVGRGTTFAIPQERIRHLVQDVLSKPRPR